MSRTNYDVITFGSATWDTFMRTKSFQVVKNKKFTTGKGLCLNLGSKVEVEDIRFSSGGGGTNTAATFAKQGFRVAFCGMVGDDIGGEKIIKELADFGVVTRFILKNKIKPTNHSVVLNPEKEDRTILVYRGASELMRQRDIDFSKLKSAQWFYLAPLSGLLCQISEKIVDFANRNNIKVAFNPGNSQLSMPIKTVRKVLKKIDILFLNQEEASLLTKIPFQKEKDIFKKIDELCPGIAIMTKGPDGVVVSDGRHLYRAKPKKIKVVDRTGAGDSFASGFVSAFIRSGSIGSGIELGIANANACLSDWGAKSRLLDKNDKFERIKVEKELCSQNGLCKTK